MLRYAAQHIAFGDIVTTIPSERATLSNRDGRLVTIIDSPNETMVREIIDELAQRWAAQKGS